MRLRQRGTALGAALVAALGVGLGTAGPATAAPLGHAFLVVGNGHCIYGGSIDYVEGSVAGVWAGADRGDNIVWPTVRLDSTNTFAGRAFCDRTWGGGGYWVSVPLWQFRPSYDNQMFAY